MLDNEFVDNQNNRASRFSWVIGLPKNKGTYSTLGVIGLTSGIILTVFEPIGGYGALFTGISLTAVGTVCAMAYSRLKMNETKDAINEISEEIKQQERVPAKYFISNNTISNTNSLIQSISAFFVLAGSSSAYAGTYKEVFDNEESEETILNLGISGGVLVATGMVCGVFSHNFLAGILAGRRNNLQNQRSDLQNQLMTELRRRAQQATAELQTVGNDLQQLQNFRNDNEQLIQQLDRAENYLNDLTANKNELTERLNQLGLINYNLNIELKKITQEKEKIQEKISSQKEIIDGQKKTIDECQSSHQKIEKLLGNKDNEIFRLESTLSEIEKNLELTQQANSYLTEELKAKKETITILQTEISELNSKVTHSDSPSPN